VLRRLAPLVRRRRVRLAPLREFLSTEAAGGAVLVAAAAVALLWANAPWGSTYEELWDTRLAVELAGHALALDLRHWVNEALMVAFFLVVGLEIKRELVDGELRDPRHAAAPVVAAVGGMVVPAALYAAWNAGTPGADGWGIPMATDIALAVGVLTMVRPRVPDSLKLFLLALAIVDDIGAVIVIAAFYSGGVDVGMLVVAVGTVVAAAVGRVVGLRWVPLYVTLGVVGWLALHESGVHATLIGVAFGLLAPTTAHVPAELVDPGELADVSNVAAARRSASLARQTTSTLEWLEYRLHPWSTFAVLPLFALANAGVRLSAGMLGDAASSRVTAGVVVGLLVGKTLGIAGAVWLASRARLVALPDGASLAHVAGVGVLAGIGFTVSLFVTELAFTDPTVADEARVGVFAASIVAGGLGAVVLRAVARRRLPGGGPAGRGQ
jgi:NhaA family Na+:H+ antiporter